MLLMPVVQIGESISKSEVATRASERFPHIPWNEIRGFRNRIVHAYELRAESRSRALGCRQHLRCNCYE